jgi:predicted nucleotide-binding protein
VEHRRLLGLAWDDERPNEASAWMVTLDRALRQLEIKIKITDETQEFLDQFREGFWDFVVLDVYQKGRTKDEFDPAGLRLAERVSQTSKRRFIPIFLVTEKWANFGKDAPPPPRNVHYMSKNAGHHVVAQEINYTLRSSLFKDPKKVFIIHGKTGDWQDEIEAAVRAAGLVPIILEREPSGALTLVHKLETHSQVGCAIVLITADDFGQAIAQTDLAQLRVRQNGLFELGYFYGALGPERLVLLARGQNVEWPSMLNGLVRLNLDTMGDWKTQLTRELEPAGLLTRQTSIAPLDTLRTRQHCSISPKFRLRNFGDLATEQLRLHREVSAINRLMVAEEDVSVEKALFSSSRDFYSGGEGPAREFGSWERPTSRTGPPTVTILFMSLTRLPGARQWSGSAPGLDGGETGIALNGIPRHVDS